MRLGLRVESITFKRTEDSEEENGLLIVKTLNGAVVPQKSTILDGESQPVKDLYSFRYNGRVALDYDTGLSELGVTTKGSNGELLSEVQSKIYRYKLRGTTINTS